MTGNFSQDVLVVLTLTGALFFLVRGPEANWCAGLTVLVGQAEGAGNVWTSRILYALLALSLVRALSRGGAWRNIHSAFRVLRGYAWRSLLLVALLLLFVKCVTESLIQGIDYDREAVLKAYVYLCAAPAALVGLAFLTRTADGAFDIILKGLCYFSFSMFTGYFVDNALMARAAADAIFLHCLPAHRGEEVADEVIEGPQSRVFDEAENRLHAQKAIMATLMGG